MAMNMNCRGAYLQNHCRNYSPYHPKIKDNNHFIHRLTDSKGNPAPPKGISHLPFQPMTPFQPMKSPPPQHEQRHLVTSTSVTPRPPSSVPPTLVRPPQPVQKPHRKEPLSQAIQEEKPTREVDRDPALEGLCRPLYCKVCNVTLNSAQQAQAHYQGKNHNKKLKNYTATNHYPSPSRASHTADTPAPQPPPPPPVVPQNYASNPMSSPKVGRVILATENDYCKLCDASFSSPAVAQAHYQGKNHAKRLRLTEAQQNNLFTDSSQLNKRRPRKEGNEFKMMQNRRNVQNSQNNPASPYFNPRPRLRIPRDLAMCVTPSGQFYCSMCNAGAIEEAEFRQHLESKQHKSKVSEQRYRSEMENLGYA
uniref:Zinc finger matrin-type protein 3 n=1 Tax=Latimeria chalumnae TaxID=7897 RepID=H3B7N9_LATCH